MSRRFTTNDQTSIISNINRSDCEEHHMKFSDVVEPGGDHDPWAYIYLLAHLKQKERDSPDDLSGIEAMICEKFKSTNITWLPHKITLRMQVRGLSAELEDSDAIEAAFGRHKTWLLSQIDSLRAGLASVDELKSEVSEINNAMSEMNGTAKSEMSELKSAISEMSELKSAISEMTSTSQAMMTALAMKEA